MAAIAVRARTVRPDPSAFQQPCPAHYRGGLRMDFGKGHRPVEAGGSKRCKRLGIG